MKSKMVEFLNSKVENTLYYRESETSAFGYVFVKVKVSDRFDYIFRGYSDVNLSSSALNILGLYDNNTGKLYASLGYTFDKLFKGVKLIDIYDITSEIKKRVDDTYNKYINENKADFMRLGERASNQYINNEQNELQLQSKANDYYIRDLSFDNYRFETNFLSGYYSSSSDIVPVTVLISYLEDSSGFINSKVHDILDEDNEYIYSHTVGVPDIRVTRKEKIGFTLLENEKIEKLKSELSLDKHSLATKKRDILRVLEDNNMVNVNVTVINKGELLTFKYPVKQLFNMYVSDWYIPDTITRNKYKKLFNDKYYYDDLVISKIVKITYGKNVIYEGRDISKE